jgi:hypothetical protein
MSNPSEPRFTGWFRPPRGAWRQACQAESEPEAWQLLLAHVETGDLCVLPTGRSPDGRSGPAVLYEPGPGGANVDRITGLRWTGD